MVLSFPIAQATLGDTLPIASVVWSPLYSQEFTGLGSGEILTNDLGPMLWQGDVVLRPLLHTDARAKMALLNALDGSSEAFYLANPLGWWPKADPGGTLFGPWTATLKTVNADRKRVSFQGLDPGAVLSAGDFFAGDYSTSRRALIQLVGAVTADGSGETAEVEVRPHLRAGIAAAMAVTFAKPAAKVKIVPGSLQQQYQNANRTRISFSVRQSLQQG